VQSVFPSGHSIRKDTFQAFNHVSNEHFNKQPFSQNKYRMMLIDLIKKRITVKNLCECQTTQNTEDEICQATDNLKLS
jgi:hypothetical protein